MEIRCCVCMGTVPGDWHSSMETCVCPTADGAPQGRACQPGPLPCSPPPPASGTMMGTGATRCESKKQAAPGAVRVRGLFSHVEGRGAGREGRQAPEWALLEVAGVGKGTGVGRLDEQGGAWGWMEGAP